MNRVVFKGSLVPHCYHPATSLASTPLLPFPKLRVPTFHPWTFSKIILISDHCELIDSYNSNAWKSYNSGTYITGTGHQWIVGKDHSNVQCGT